jgi:hypothetical protein
MTVVIHHISSFIIFTKEISYTITLCYKYKDKLSLQIQFCSWLLVVTIMRPIRRQWRNQEVLVRVFLSRKKFFCPRLVSMGGGD